MSRFSPNRQLMMFLTFLALAIKAMIPAGYMLDHTGGGFIITLCAPDGNRDVVYDPASGQLRELTDEERQDQSRDHSAGQVCPFSALLAAASPASGAATLPPFDLAKDSFLPVPDDIPANRHITGKASPRAPPFQSFL